MRWESVNHESDQVIKPERHKELPVPGRARELASQVTFEFIGEELGKDVKMAIAHALRNIIPFIYVLYDSWFSLTLPSFLTIIGS